MRTDFVRALISRARAEIQQLALIGSSSLQRLRDSCILVRSHCQHALNCSGPSSIRELSSGVHHVLKLKRRKRKTNNHQHHHSSSAHHITMAFLFRYCVVQRVVHKSSRSCSKDPQLAASIFVCFTVRYKFKKLAAGVSLFY